MKPFIKPALIMLGILVLFFIFGGAPRPGDINWDAQTWTYEGRNWGVIKYINYGGSEFTIDRRYDGSFILGIDGRNYTVSISRQQVRIRFPDGREAVGIIRTLLEGVARVAFPTQVELSKAELSAFNLAAEVHRVFPSKALPIFLTLLFLILGALCYRLPLASAKWSLAFRAWMVKDPEPTEEYVESMRIIGGFVMVVSWIGLLTVIW